METVLSYGNNPISINPVADNGSFFVIPGQFGPRWIVPNCPLYGTTVLEQWQPYNLMSKLKWRTLLSLYRLRLLGYVPGIRNIKINPGITGAKITESYASIPVIYVGTPGPQQKAVVTLVSQGNGTPQNVMKIALGKRAGRSMLQEAAILENLADLTSLVIPVMYGSADTGNRTWQTFIPGRPSARKLTQKHIDWLLRLPRSRQKTTLDEQHQFILQAVEQESSLAARYQSDISNAFALIQGGEIPLTLVHGDFVPWNIKLLANNQIAAVDWEDAELNGFPLWDLCHFFLMQGYLFRDRKPLADLSASPLVNNYLQKMKLSHHEFTALRLIYILRTVFDKKNAPSGEDYKNYLMQQIPEVLAN